MPIVSYITPTQEMQIEVPTSGVLCDLDFLAIESWAMPCLRAVQDVVEEFAPISTYEFGILSNDFEQRFQEEMLLCELEEHEVSYILTLIPFIFLYTKEVLSKEVPSLNSITQRSRRVNDILAARWVRHIEKNISKFSFEVAHENDNLCEFNDEDDSDEERDALPAS